MPRAPKLRKMLGCSTDNQMLPLMSLIETQSLPTLMNWANTYIKEVLLPIWNTGMKDDDRPARAHEAAEAYARALAQGSALRGPKADLAAAVRGARDAAKDASVLGTPVGVVCEAAAKAIATGSAIASTATNALGWTFYAAAAVAYHQLGCQESPLAYDAAAHDVQSDLLARLKALAVPDDPDHVRVVWHC